MDDSKIPSSLNICRFPGMVTPCVGVSPPSDVSMTMVSLDELPQLILMYICGYLNNAEFVRLCSASRKLLWLRKTRPIAHYVSPKVYHSSPYIFTCIEVRHRKKVYKVPAEVTRIRSVGSKIIIHAGVTHLASIKSKIYGDCSGVRRLITDDVSLRERCGAAEKVEMLRGTTFPPAKRVSLGAPLP